MIVLRRMAGITIHWRAFEVSIHVTGGTSDASMVADQRECSGVVIVEYVTPLRRFMTRSTTCPKLPIVVILRHMAGITIRWCAFKIPVCMAGSTGNSRMCISQWECGGIVVVKHILPGRRRVA